MTGLKECAWSTADYSVEVSVRKVLLCAALCMCASGQYLHVYAFMIEVKTCICLCVHIGTLHACVYACGCVFLLYDIVHMYAGR